MTSEKSWVEELLDLANIEYYEQMTKPKAPRTKKVSVPDLSDNEFWDKGESTS